MVKPSLIPIEYSMEKKLFLNSSILEKANPPEESIEMNVICLKFVQSVAF